MRRALILFTSLVIVVAVMPWVRPQGFEGRDSMQGLGPFPPFHGTALIGDTKGRFGPSHVKGMERYSITLCNGETILVDSATGNKWLLTSTLKDNEPEFRWIPISRSDRAQAVLKKPSIQPKETSSPLSAQVPNASGVQSKEQGKQVPWSLLPVPTIKLNNNGKATESETKRIKKLIAELAEIDSYDKILPPEAYAIPNFGTVFVPVPSSNHFEICSSTKCNSAFTSLVDLGPKALPFLLESLDDKTPTKITIKHEGGFGGMWFCHEIQGNPANKHEAKVLADVKPAVKSDDSPRTKPLVVVGDDTSLVHEYTLKVGDICFVAVGQITNRPYNAFRYQPTACYHLNSTVVDKTLAAEVRAIWDKSEYRQELLDSLMVDLHTREAESVFLEAEAATRLLYYFPQATEDLIVARLKGLDISAADASEQVEPTDMLTDDFLRGVSWSSQPKIRAELLEIFRRTTDPQTLLAAMPGVGKEHDDLVFGRLTARLARLPTGKHKPYSHARFDAQSLLIALGNRFPDRAEAVFQQFLKPGTIECYRTMVYVLRETCGTLASRLLAPRLEDKRDFGENYLVNPKENLLRLQTRICDAAAETIAMHSKTLKFVMQGSHEDLDRQIEVMRRKIAEVNPKN
jgi:hypothetical protein